MDEMDEWQAREAAAAAGGAEEFPYLSPEAEAEMKRLAELVLAKRRLYSDEARYQAQLARAAQQMREAYEGRNPKWQSPM